MLKVSYFIKSTMKIIQTHLEIVFLKRFLYKVFKEQDQLNGLAH